MQRNKNCVYMKRTEVVNRIAELVHKIVPDAQVILFGSEARGDAHANSDIDVLILLDKPRITRDDFNNVSYSLRELGWEVGEVINPVLYTVKDWTKNSFSLFYKNVMKDGIVL